MWPIVKVFIEFVTILLLFHVLGFFDHQAYGLLADQIHTSCIGRGSLSHWTIREVPIMDHILMGSGVEGKSWALGVRATKEIPAQRTLIAVGPSATSLSFLLLIGEMKMRKIISTSQVDSNRIMYVKLI